MGTSGVLTYINVFTTVQGQLVDPYGIHSDDFFTWLGVYVQGFGVIGGIVFGILLTAYPSKMMAAAYTSCIMSIVCLAYFYAADIAANKVQLSISSGMIGFFLLPMFIASFELAAIQTRDDGVTETMSCGLINIINQVVGFLICISLTPALKAETHKSTMVNFIVLFAILFLSLIFLIIGSIIGNKKKARKLSNEA